MAAAQIPRYSDPEYQHAHEKVFSNPLDKSLPTILPPGISQGDVDTALDEVAAIIGKEAVRTGEQLREFVDPYEVPEKGVRHIPGAAVLPSSVEEVQGVVKVFNKFKIPVWTVSRGKNFGYGGPSPAVNGSVIIDLHRMDKVLEVNDKFAYGVVEPGVTFASLYAYCVAHKHKVWPSTASIGWGSVTGNTLDRGMGFTPTGMHHENIAGLEVVLANGDVVRTGQFACTKSPSAHLTHMNFGPSIDGLFLQSNLGIVTKMGIWMTPQPQAYMSCGFNMPEFDDIATMIDAFGVMRRNGTIASVIYMFYLVEWASILQERHNFWQGEGPIPEWRLAEIQKELDTGRWVCRWGLYGPPNLIQAQADEITRYLKEVAPTGRTTFQLFKGGENGELLDAASIEFPHGSLFVGVPSLRALAQVNFYNPPDGSGQGGHGCYAPIIPLDGKVMLEWIITVKKVFEDNGTDLYCDMFVSHRYAVWLSMLCYNTKDKAQRERSEKIYDALFIEGSKRGFTNYRTHLDHMEECADQMDFNNHAYRRFVETIKNSLDPNGILSPGKMGIWPSRFREAKLRINQEADNSLESLPLRL